MTNKKIVYFAEDDAPVRESGVYMLSRDYEVISFADGRQLYDAVKSRTPNAIITDGEMPRMRGYDALGKIINEGYAGPAIMFCTPYTQRDKNDLEELKKKGVEFIRKPDFMEVSILLSILFSEKSQPVKDTGTDGPSEQ